MSKKPDIRSFWNPVPRLAEGTQKGLLTGELYGPKERNALIQSVRRGSIVEVVELYLLAKSEGRSDARKRDLLKTWNEIEERGGSILEQSTGRSSSKPKEAREMQAQAFEQISASGRGRKSALVGALSQGAPKRILTKDERHICEEEWFDSRNRTIDDAMVRIRGRLGKKAPGRTYLYKLLGSPYASRDNG